MSSPLKVLYLMHDSRRSGVPAVMAALIRSLDRSRVTPSVLFAYHGVYAEELRGQGVEVESLGQRLPFIWRLNRILFNLCLPRLVRRVDVVHVNSIVLAPSVLVAKWLGARVVLHLHEKPGRLGRVLIKAIGVADCVVFCAQNCADHYASVPALRRRTILNAVTLPEAVPEEKTTGRRKIVMFGSINKNKGQDLLLKAFALLDPADAELYFYGTVGLSAHGYVRSLKEFVVRNGMSDRVFFPGPTNDAAAVMRRATLLVHSSLNECMSISVLEALSCGVPVVANAITGMDEIITDGVNGFLVPPGDLQVLADRIGRLLADGDLRLAMGQAGVATVAENFNMKQRAEMFVGLYGELTR